MAEAKAQAAKTLREIKQKPLWLQIVILVVGIFVALNLLSLIALPILDSLGSAGGGLGGTLLMVGPVIYLLWYARRRDGMNIWKALGNPKISDYTRTEDSSKGGVLFVTTPARPLRKGFVLAFALAFFTLTLFSLLTGYMGLYGFLPAFWLGLCLWIELPFAQYRRPANILVTQDAINADGDLFPKARIVSISSSYSGHIVKDDPIMAGPNGVSTSQMVGREIGKDYAARNHAVEIRLEGEAYPQIIAGGLTPTCADSLAEDLRRALG